tara:strand:+ start:237 stop:842 length:606 start_codon:yes stop_codon:yes gene_type:complete
MQRTLHRSLITLAIAAATAATPLAFAQQQQANAPATRASGDMKMPAMPRTDANFMKQAAENGHAEVEASKMALQKASNPEVKKFAQQMIDDHTKVGQELMQLASTKGVELPTEPSLVQKGKAKAMLDTAEGEKFDQRYVASMGVDAHEDTLKLFRKAAKDAKDPDVKAWAAKTVPALEHHLQMAKALDAQVNKKGGKSASK